MYVYSVKYNNMVPINQEGMRGVIGNIVDGALLPIASDKASILLGKLSLH